VASIEVSIDVAAADVNGDGRPDVLLPLINSVTNKARVILHAAGNGKDYLAPVDYPIAANFPSAILAADLNSDQYPDLVISGARQPASSVVVLINDATTPGVFHATQAFDVSNPNQVAVADVNGDGLPDLIIAADTLMVALQNASTPGTFEAPTTIYPNYVASLAVKDIDGDGMPDIVVSDLQGTKVLFLAPGGGGTPAIASTLQVLTSAVGQNVPPASVASADLNGDGHSDVVIVDPASSSLVVLLQDPAHVGQFLVPVTYPLPAGTGSKIVVTDLNGDGYPDIVTGGSSAVAVWLQDGARRGALLGVATYAVPFGADAIAIADVDGDGHPDIVTNAGVSNSGGDLLKTPPGVMYQDAASPGIFLALRDLGS
jgi:hypothetical protein